MLQVNHMPETTQPNAHVPSGGAETVTYVIQRDASPALAAKRDWQEMWGPPLLTLVGALIGVTVPLFFKWYADRRERRQALRRDIYLKLVEAVTDAGTATGMLTSVETPLKDIMKMFGDAASAVSRAEVVAPMPIVRALARLENETQKHLLRYLENGLLWNSHRFASTLTKRQCENIKSRLKAHWRNKRR